MSDRELIYNKTDLKARVFQTQGRRIDVIFTDAISASFFNVGGFMETRIANIAIIVYDKESAEKINLILHDYGEYIIGRMGIPYKPKNVSVISVVLDAPNEIIGALSGKLGMIPNVSAKVVYSKI